MSEKIEETLRRLAAGMSKASSPSSSSTDDADASGPRATLGDPECPHCHGLGYLRRDLPLDDPGFGRLELCICRQAEVRAQIRSRLFSLSRLHQLEKLTFDTFHPKGRDWLGLDQQSSIEQAFETSRNFAHTLDGWLLLQGGYGCGKTHLAAAIANECVSLGVPTLFLTVPDLLDSLRSSFDDEAVSFEERFDQIRDAPLLVLDDFGTQSATQWAREKLFQLLNHRHINRLPTVITTNLALREIDGRMRSRLSDPNLVAHVLIQAPDYRRPEGTGTDDDLSSLGLHSQQTFSTFELRTGERLSSADRENLRKVKKAAQAFAEKPDGWMVFSGSYGCGKTHLAAAIANHRAAKGLPAMFVVVPDLLDHLRATFSPSSTASYDRRFDEVRSAPFLVLDDLGVQATTPWAQEKLFQLINHRYNARLPTVITTSDEPKNIDARLRARILDTRICSAWTITAPMFHG